MYTLWPTLTLACKSECRYIVAAGMHTECPTCSHRSLNQIAPTRPPFQRDYHELFPSSLSQSVAEPSVAQGHDLAPESWPTFVHNSASWHRAFGAPSVWHSHFAGQRFGRRPPSPLSASGQCPNGLKWAHAAVRSHTEPKEPALMGHPQAKLRCSCSEARGVR